MKMSGSERKKTTPAEKTEKARNRIDEIFERVKELLHGSTDEELAWIMFDIDNPEPTQQEMEAANESIGGSRLKNREGTITKLAEAAFDFGIMDEPPQELADWLKDKQSVRAFILERRLGGRNSP
jgi:hypothetical protein